MVSVRIRDQKCVRWIIDLYAVSEIQAYAVLQHHANLQNGRRIVIPAQLVVIQM